MNINDLYKEMEHYAKINNVPIMLKSGIDYLVNFVLENNIKSVLEIGTAIGYSTIKLRSVSSKVTSIERDANRYNVALNNAKLSNFDNIELIHADALEVNISGKYDLIFIDASKGHNIEFIKKYKNNLSNGGTIIIDNVDFHGLVGNSDTIKSRNLRSLVRKIEKFIDYLDNQEEFSVEKVSVGDGLIILRRNV